MNSVTSTLLKKYRVNGTDEVPMADSSAVKLFSVGLRTKYFGGKAKISYSGLNAELTR